MLVKIVRLLANLAINPTLGERLSRQRELLLLPELLGAVTKDPHAEELMLNSGNALDACALYA